EKSIGTRSVGRPRIAENCTNFTGSIVIIYRHVLRFLLVLTLVMPALLRAQFTSPSTNGSLPTSAAPDKTLMPPSASEAAFASSTVDPNEYHLGPGDVLQCRFWTSDQSFFPVISSDEMLIVNRIGEFS